MKRERDIYIYIYIYIEPRLNLSFVVDLKKKMQHSHWLASGGVSFGLDSQNELGSNKAGPPPIETWHTIMSQYIKMKNNAQELRLIYEHCYGSNI